MTRAEKIKKRLFEVEYVTKKEWWGMNETILTNDAIKKEPLVVRKALGIEYVMRNMPAEIKPDELIVGIATMAATGLGYEFPDYALPEEKEEALRSCYTFKSVWGHHPGDYEKLLRVGVKGLREEIYAKLREEAAKPGCDAGKIDYYRAMLISINSLNDLSYRYAQLTLDEAAKTVDSVRRQELLTISEICNRVPENPASSLHEALQSVFFMMCALQSTLEIVPLGRVDQYLYPYYKHDLETGVLTKEQAEELIVSWLAKFSERVQTNPEFFEANHETALNQSDGGDPENYGGSFAMENDKDYNFGTSANHFLLNMILGGQNPDGTDATNDLTYLLLEQWAYLEAIVPVCSVRLHKNAPARLYDMCARILRDGSGEPALYNDEVVIQGLVDIGIPIEDARCYSNDGCWETLIPGKTNFGFEYVNILQILEHALHHGRSLVRQKQEAEDLGDPCACPDFDTFYSTFFLPLIQKRMEFVLKTKLRYRADRYKIAPSPLLSAIMDGCIESGRDLSNDGARYNIYPLMLTGVANCIDSLVVLKELVYEQKLITMDDVVKATACNYVGYEAMQQLVKNRAPKFGNDDDRADEMAVRVLGDCAKVLDEVKAHMDVEDLLTGLGVATFETYMSIGYNMGASPDGRGLHESISSNLSPALGVDKNGPTAVIKSITKPDLIKYFNGCPLDMQINANEAGGEEGVKRIVALIQSFMELGGVILTLTGVNEKDMIAAQKDPKKYANLRVRMGGLSAYFVALPKEHQDTLIRKIKHTV